MAAIAGSSRTIGRASYDRSAAGLLHLCGSRGGVPELLSAQRYVVHQVARESLLADNCAGNPISETDIFSSGAVSGQQPRSEAQRPSDITLVRSRIFYAKPALTAKGLVQPGFKHIRMTPFLQDCSITNQVQMSSTDVLMFRIPKHLREVELRPRQTPCASGMRRTPPKS